MHSLSYTQPTAGASSANRPGCRYPDAPLPKRPAACRLPTVDEELQLELDRTQASSDDETTALSRRVSQQHPATSYPSDRHHASAKLEQLGNAAARAYVMDRFGRLQKGPGKPSLSDPQQKAFDENDYCLLQIWLLYRAWAMWKDAMSRHPSGHVDNDDSDDEDGGVLIAGENSDDDYEDDDDDDNDGSEDRYTFSGSPQTSIHGYK